MKKITIKELAIGFPYKPLTGSFGYSSSFIIKGNKTILFDTGNYGIRKEILSNLSKIECVIISHLHFDHCANLDLFINSQTPIYISKDEIKYYILNMEKDKDLFSYFNYIRDKLNIILISENMIIDKNIEIILTPGHTPGHISLSVNTGKEQILFAGDSIKSFKDYKNMNIHNNSYNRNRYIRTKKFLKEKYEIIYPGHDSIIKYGKKGVKFKTIKL